MTEATGPAAARVSALLPAGPARRGGSTGRFRAAAAAACLLFPLTGWSHAFWLVPFGPNPEVGQRVALDLRIGPRWPGVTTPRLPGLVADFHVLDAQGRRPVGGRTNGVPVGHFEARTAGAAIVVMQTNPASLSLPGPEFQQYLREEGLGEVLKLRERLGVADNAVREDFSRGAKTLVVVGGDADGFDRTVGMPFELVPLTNPVTYRAGTPFRARLLLGGGPAVGVRVAALPKNDPENVVEARTDSHGEVALALPRGGFWTLYAVHLQPAPRPPAEWESTWASLTLALPEPP